MTSKEFKKIQHQLGVDIPESVDISKKDLVPFSDMQFSDVQRDLGLNDREMAAIFKRTPRTIKKWKNEKKRLPEIVAFGIYYIIEQYIDMHGGKFNKKGKAIRISDAR